MNDNNPHGLRYLPAENAQLTEIHRKVHDRLQDYIGDQLIEIQDETAALYQRQIDRLYESLVCLLGPTVTQEGIDTARALVKELRS